MKLSGEQRKQIAIGVLKEIEMDIVMYEVNNESKLSSSEIDNLQEDRDTLNLAEEIVTNKSELNNIGLKDIEI